MTQLKSKSKVGNQKHENLGHIQLCKSIAFQQYINKLDRTRRESGAILATTLAPLPIELSPTSRRMGARADEWVATPVNCTVSSDEYVGLQLAVEQLLIYPGDATRRFIPTNRSGANNRGPANIQPMDRR